MHASGDSPWHSSAKHHILEACFFRMTPFRSMLLTLQSGLQRLTPRAQSVPAYAQVLRHSSMALSRRTHDHVVERFTCALKATRGEDVQVEHPIRPECYNTGNRPVAACPQDSRPRIGVSIA